MDLSRLTFVSLSVIPRTRVIYCAGLNNEIRGEEKIGLNLFYRLNSGRYRTRNVDRDLATLPQLPDLKK